MVDPKSPATTGYHLFLEPSGDVADELQRIIRTLAEEYGSPVFAPHITVASRIPTDLGEEVTREKVTLLAQNSAPFSVVLGEVGMEDAYYRALYLHIEKTPVLEKLHATAVELFTLSHAGQYTPHVSLLYGNFSQEDKEESAGTFALLNGTSFMVNRLHLYRTEGEVGQWEKIAEFPFQG